MPKNKEYKVGDVFYRYNKKTKELEELQIEYIQYVFDKKIGSRANYTTEEIQKLMTEGVITDDANVLKLEAIAKIEKQFGIKLKEV